MVLDLSNTLVVGISATALFDMSESDQIFKTALEADPESVIDSYRRYMEEHEDEPLSPGTGYHLAKALLDLNRHMKSGELSPLVEVVVMSRNSPDTGIRVLKTIRRDQLAITRSAFTGGESVADYMDAFDVDLFLYQRGRRAKGDRFPAMRRCDPKGASSQRSANPQRPGTHRFRR
nr:5'-nucleotidase [Pseudomonas endophytica]